MTTNISAISDTKLTCSEESCYRDHRDNLEGMNNMKKVILMGGCLIILLLCGLFRLTFPSTDTTVVQQRAIVHHDSVSPSSIRGFVGGRFEENPFDRAGYLVPGKDMHMHMHSEATHLVLEDQTSRQDTSRHRRLQVEGSYPQNSQAQQKSREPDRPIMYTFYALIEGHKGTGMSDEADQKLLQVWKEEWTRHGWEPRIIGLETAQRHRDFAHLNGMLAGLQMKVYDRYCFLRYLAMSVVLGGWMSDYDTFPLHPFDSSLPNEGRLTVHEYSKNGGVPDLVSGSADEFDRMALLLIENAYKRRSEPFWSDMFALHDLYIASGGSVYAKASHVMPGQVITRRTRSDKVCQRTNGKYAVHFSHFAMEFGGTEGAGPEQRAEIAQNWLKQWRAMCLNDGKTESVYFFE